MTRIVCFADSTVIAQSVRQALGECDIHVLPASQLTNETRKAVQTLAPDVILMELTRETDNAHLYFFLRSDYVTRSTPVILVSPSERLAQQAAILQADGFLQRQFLAEQLHGMIQRHAPPLMMSAAA